MRRVILAAAIAATLAIVPAAHAAGRGGGGGGGGGGGHGGFGGRGGGWGHGWHGHGFHGPHSRVFFGGSVFFDPFFYDPFYYPYYAPYAYPAYVYPPPADYGWSAPPEAPPEEESQRGAEGSSEAEDEAAARATYGLVQLRGVPNGASVYLDRRFWLTAKDLDERWLALPRGEHSVSVHMPDGKTVERRVDVREGKNHVVRFSGSSHATG